MLDSRVGEQPVDEAAPPVVEGDGRRHLVEHLDAWRQPRLDGVLDQQPLGEAVERADGGAVELAQCLDAAGGDGRAGAGRAVAGPEVELALAGVAPGVAGAGALELVVEAPAHTVAQLGRGLLGERDGRDLVEARGAGDDQLGDALDEGARLPRPGGRLHEQRLVERLRDAVARRLVGRIGRRGVGRRGVGPGGRVARSCRYLVGFGQHGVAAHAGGVPLALPGAPEVGHAEAVGVTPGASAPGAERLDRVGGERALLDAVDDGAQRARDPVDHPVVDVVPPGGEPTLLGHEPVLGAHGGPGCLRPRPSGERIHDELELRAAGRRGCRR